MQSMSKLVNTEALESAIYNPPMEPKAVMLQEIMETPGMIQNVRTTRRRPHLITPAEVPVELKEHIENFNNLPIFNPFQGVIENPTKCYFNDIAPILTGDLVNYMDGRFSDNGTWTTYRDEELNQDLADLHEDLECVEDHTDTLIANLPGVSGIAQASMALSTVMNLLSNPCLGLGNFLGSIMDQGKQLLADIQAKIQGALADARAWVSAQIGPLIDKIKGAIADAKAKMLSMINKVKDEVLNFAKAMLAQVRQGLAELLAHLPQDPCLRSILGSVATGAAAAVIGG